MRTKPFLLATAGSTVDGRVIDDTMLEEMASSYNPKTYGARLNIEHIRGISGQPPFRAYGDVLELSIGEVDVDFNGTTEKRKALYGVFDVTEDAKALNAASQKVYPSIEIEPNFGGKGNAYLMGVALTDSPASIATERMQFNYQRPGTIHLSREVAADFAFDEAMAGAEGADGIIARFGTMLEQTFAKFTPPKPEAKPEAKPNDDTTEGFSAADLKPLFEGLGQTFATEIGGLRSEMREEIDRFAVKLKKLEDEHERAPAPNYTRRPPADGGAGDYAGVF